MTEMECIDGMLPEVRRVFCLRKVYEHTPAQIAEELHLHPARVERDLELAALAMGECDK
jgi:DNA-directed RNA polymerase specialized sigma24 family protein